MSETPIARRVLDRMRRQVRSKVANLAAFREGNAYAEALQNSVVAPDKLLEMHSAHAGEKLPIAKVPAGTRFRPGDESVYAGKGSFYTLRYGSYLIGMNMTPDKTFELNPPTGIGEAKDLVSGKTLKLDAPMQVAPRSTIVLWLGK